MLSYVSLMLQGGVLMLHQSLSGRFMPCGLDIIVSEENILLLALLQLFRPVADEEAFS